MVKINSRKFSTVLQKFRKNPIKYTYSKFKGTIILVAKAKSMDKDSGAYL